MKQTCLCNRHREVLFLFLSSFARQGTAFMKPLHTQTHTSLWSIKSQRRNRRTQSHHLSLFTRSDDDRAGADRVDDDIRWEVGDVYKDLDRLEFAINHSNAEENLKHVERMETLEHFAKQRRPVLRDIGKFLVAPLALALVLSTTQQLPKTRLLARVVVKSFDVYFWAVVVFAPLILLGAKKLLSPPPEPMPEELVGLAPEYLPFVTTDWEDPEISCRDYCLFLLEYWASSVAGMALVGLLGRLVTFPKHRVISLWWSCAQVITRVAALASLHQYPQQLYQLQRSQQPRPLALFPSMMKPLIRNIFLLAPLALASDLSKVLIHMHKDSLIALYATISLVLFGTSLRMIPKDALSFQKLEPRPLGTKLAYVATSAAIWRKPLANLALDVQQFPFQSLSNQFRRVPLKVLFAGITCGSIGVAPIVGPLIHLLVIGKIVRVIFTHDMSLGMEEPAFRAMLEDQAAQSQRMTWRYRLNWREPKRLPQLLREWNRDWAHWWFVKGSVGEKLELELHKIHRMEAREGRTLWDKITKDIAGDPFQGIIRDRDDWKNDAMRAIAKKHQMDYDRKQFDDPLGVAVQQTLGIGLGFNFDHQSKLGENETPSLRRLQTRAAKSAIRRVQRLYDAQGAREILEGITDRQKREKKAKELRLETEKEVRFLAQRLSELVPTGKSKEFDNNLQIERYRPTNYVKTSSHEYTMLDPLNLDDPFEGMVRFKRFSDSDDIQSEKTSPGGDSPLSTGDLSTGDESIPSKGEGAESETSKEASPSDDDDAFIEAYLEQQLGKGKDDDETTTFLA